MLTSETALESKPAKAILGYAPSLSFASATSTASASAYAIPVHAMNLVSATSTATTTRCAWTADASHSVFAWTTAFGGLQTCREIPPSVSNPASALETSIVSVASAKMVDANRLVNSDECVGEGELCIAGHCGSSGLIGMRTARPANVWRRSGWCIEPNICEENFDCLGERLRGVVRTLAPRRRLRGAQVCIDQRCVARPTVSQRGLPGSSNL